MQAGDISIKPVDQLPVATQVAAPTAVVQQPATVRPAAPAVVQAPAAPQPAIVQPAAPAPAEATPAPLVPIEPTPAAGLNASVHVGSDGVSTALVAHHTNSAGWGSEWGRGYAPPPLTPPPQGGSEVRSPSEPPQQNHWRASSGFNHFAGRFRRCATLRAMPGHGPR